MADVIHVRNGRPNRLIVKYAGVKFLLERRGSREDTTSLPAEAENDPIVARFLRQGFLEKISKEAFMTLNERTEDQRLALDVKRANEIEVPMGHAASQTPTVIADKDLQETAHLRTVDLQFANAKPTDVELGFVTEEDDSEPTVDEEKEEMRRQIEELQAQLAAKTDVPKKTATPRKRSTSASKSTRAKRS